MMDKTYKAKDSWIHCSGDSKMKAVYWETSSSEASDAGANSNDANGELCYPPGSLPKLQFRSDVSKATWRDEICMAEVVEKRGKLWTTTGIVRRGKTYCSLEETLFLLELGGLILMDDKDVQLSLKDTYVKIEDRKNGCCRELFEVYKHLKSLGYIVGRHEVPWSVKAIKCNCANDTPESNNNIIGTEVKDTSSIVEKLSNLQMNDELRLNFDVYLPNSKFRKSSPGDPAFSLCLIRDDPPLRGKIETLERQCREVPLKLCHVDHGRVSFFSFTKVELPVLP